MLFLANDTEHTCCLYRWHTAVLYDSFSQVSLLEWTSELMQFKKEELHCRQ
ncbi:UNVERIFIED_CONTAM: hypothetical protein FKN15_064215 [Acipenser sinensis]